MKTHKTITVTKRMLCKKLNACDGGVADVKSFLPATVSTDPEDNIKLAIKLIEAGVGHHAAFIVNHVAYDPALYLSLEERSNSLNGQTGLAWYKDPYTMAQMLAAGADAILTSKGR